MVTTTPIPAKKQLQKWRGAWCKISLNISISAKLYANMKMLTKGQSSNEDGDMASREADQHRALPGQLMSDQLCSLLEIPSSSKLVSTSCWDVQMYETEFLPRPRWTSTYSQGARGKTRGKMWPSNVRDLTFSGGRVGSLPQFAMGAPSVPRRPSLGKRSVFWCWHLECF